MEVIKDGKNTLMRIEEMLIEKMKSEDELNKKILKQNIFILFFTVLIFILTLSLVYLTIVPK